MENIMQQSTEQSARMRIAVVGAVQGVGFRPFIYRLARENGLTGWVQNSAQGVVLELEGPQGVLDRVEEKITADKPALAVIYNMQTTRLDPAGYDGFEIKASTDTDRKTALVLPDIAACPACFEDMFDPSNRRYRYPFINCTHCGPRYSIIRRLPYDRANTAMSLFPLCAACREEYEDPANRFFHAQPVACPECGPQLIFIDGEGAWAAEKEAALERAVAALAQQQIVAVKGLGGFHLMVRADSRESVNRLRVLKHREEKPFAVMFPDMEGVAAHCEISGQEKTLLASASAPIVLLKKKSVAGRAAPRLAGNIAVHNPYLGCLLAYTPLHHLLLRACGFPVVATSGNISDEPICIDEQEALRKLTGIADCFLVHNRPIVRPVDDSVARVMAGRPLVIRRARGYAPLPVHVAQSLPVTLALGGHQKNTVALSVGDNIVVSQHVGDLDTQESFMAFERAIVSLRDLYPAEITRVACDAHPDYLSTKHAAVFQKDIKRVQHHHAHIVACMAENQVDEEVLGIAWDGTGYGLDGTVWGGEFLLATLRDFRRAGTFRAFPLPGGEAAVKEPWRTAWGLLAELFGDEVFRYQDLPCFRGRTAAELKTLLKMARGRINTPMVSSVGRLFDAVAAITGVGIRTRYEGQAAMALEFALEGVREDGVYAYEVHDAGSAPGPYSAARVIDWSFTARGILNDVARGEPAGVISAKFHNTLIRMAVDMARGAGRPKVLLSGGCFQNKYLTEGLVAALKADGFHPYWHQNIPPNDGGIALGQAVCAALKR